MMLGTSENGIYHGFIMVYPRNGNLSLFKDLNLSLRHHFSCYQSSSMIYLLKSAIFLGRLLDCQSISIISKCISINIPSTTSIFPTFHLFLSLSLYQYIYIYIYTYRHAHWVANHQDQCLPMAPLRPPTRNGGDKNSAMARKNSAMARSSEDGYVTLW